MSTLLEWDTGSLAAAGASISGTVNVVADTGFDRAVLPSTSTADNFYWEGLSATAYTLRAYLAMPSAWASVSVVLLSHDNTTTDARMILAGSGAPGQVRLARAGNTEVARSDQNIIPLSATLRWEMQVDTVSGTIRAAVFPLGADAPLWDSGLISGDVGTLVKRIRVGKLNSSTLPEISISRVKAVDTVGTWIGRHSTDPSDAPVGSIWAWDGAAPHSVDVLGILDGALHSVEIVGVWDGASLNSLAP